MNVGDTVYQLIPIGAYAKGGYKIQELTVEKIYLNDLKKLVFDTSGIAFDSEAVGKNIFFSRKEAEKVIKE